MAFAMTTVSFLVCLGPSLSTTLPEPLRWICLTCAHGSHEEKGPNQENPHFPASCSQAGIFAVVFHKESFRMEPGPHTWVSKEFSKPLSPVTSSGSAYPQTLDVFFLRQLLPSLHPGLVTHPGVFHDRDSIFSLKWSLGSQENTNMQQVPPL